MKSRCLKILVAIALGAGALLTAGALPAPAAPVTVRYLEGVTHGFLVLRGPGGETLAEGDLLQVVRPEGVDSRLIFRFRDGSLYDETVVFTQQKVFALQSYHLIQRGPTFPEELEVTFDRKGGRYQVRSRRDGGEPETAAGEVELPPDLYNGMMIMLLRNLGKGAAETVHVLAFTPKPILVQRDGPGGRGDDAGRRAPGPGHPLRHDPEARAPAGRGGGGARQDPRRLPLLGRDRGGAGLRGHRRPALHRRADLAHRDGEPARAGPPRAGALTAPTAERVRSVARAQP